MIKNRHVLLNPSGLWILFFIIFYSLGLYSSANFPMPTIPVGYVNVALNKEVTVSSEATQNTGKNVVDANTETYWQSSSSVVSQYIYVDIGSIDKVIGIAINWQDNNFAQKMKIAYSYNESNFITTSEIIKNDNNPSVYFFPKPVDARYVGLYLTELNTNIYGILEFAIYKNNNPPLPTLTPNPTPMPTPPYEYTNIALGKKIVASGEHFLYPAQNAIDGNYSTYWFNDKESNPIFLYVDLNTLETIRGIGVYWHSVMFAKSFTFAYSTDFITWISLADVIKEDGRPDFIEVSNTVNLRYVGIYCQQLNSTLLAITELEIYKNKITPTMTPTPTKTPQPSVTPDKTATPTITPYKTPSPTISPLPSASPIPEWKANFDYQTGDKVIYQNKVYQCWQSHTSLIGWEPPLTEALWILLINY